MTKKSVQPLQVRLPEDVYTALQSVASRSSRTLNSIVVEILRENLPSVDFPFFPNEPESQKLSETFDDLANCVDSYQSSIGRSIGKLGLIITNLSNDQGSLNIARAELSNRKEIFINKIESFDFDFDFDFDFFIEAEEDINNYRKEFIKLSKELSVLRAEILNERENLISKIKFFSGLKNKATFN